jgi:hypothetical protein
MQAAYGIALCECGCGKPTSLIAVNVATRGLVKGQYRKFIWGHQNKITDFWSQVDKLNGPISPLGTRCWLWTGAKSGNGYGIKMVDDQTKSAHAVAFFLAYSVWPKGRACHKCDNPPCVRPDHIFEGTAKENTADMVAKGRHSHGERHYAAKLTDIQVIEAIHKRSQGALFRELAKEYGVPRKCISDAVNGVTWKHISKEKTV